MNAGEMYVYMDAGMLAENITGQGKSKHANIYKGFKSTEHCRIKRKPWPWKQAAVGKRALQLHELT